MQHVKKGWLCITFVYGFTVTIHVHLEQLRPSVTGLQPNKKLLDLNLIFSVCELSGQDFHTSVHYPNYLTCIFCVCMSTYLLIRPGTISGYIYYRRYYNNITNYGRLEFVNALGWYYYILHFKSSEYSYNILVHVTIYYLNSSLEYYLTNTNAMET